MGSGLTFSIFTCIVPFVLIVFSVVGMVVDKPAVISQISHFIHTLIPYERSSSYIEEIVRARVNEFRIFKTWTGSLGIFGLLFAASGLFSSMRTILNTTFRVPHGRNVIIGKLYDFALIFLVAIFFLFFVMIFPALGIALNFLNRFAVIEKIYQVFASIGLGLISFSVIYFMFFILYFLIPDERPKRRVAAVSAFWAAILWEIAKEGFGYYIAHSVTLTRVYGTYIFIVALALWLYYSSLVFITGAEIGQLYRERREAKIDDEPQEEI